MKKLIALTLALLTLVLCFAGCGAKETASELTASVLAVEMMDDYFAYLDDASQNHCCIQYFKPAVSSETNNGDGTYTVTGVVNGSAMYITGEVAPFTSSFTVTLEKTDNSYKVKSVDVELPDAARY